MSIRGKGNDLIARALEEEKEPTWGRGKQQGKKWHTSYIQRILTNRSVIGEYQPLKCEGRKTAKPYGPPIKDFFPAIIEPDVFACAQERRRARKHLTGPRTKAIRNLFTGVLKCSKCGGKMIVQNKGRDKEKTREETLIIVCKDHETCRRIAWPYREFERYFLELIDRIDLTEMFDKDRSREIQLEAEMDAALGRFKELSDRIERVTRNLNEESISEDVRKLFLDSLNGYVEDKSAAEKELRSIRSKLAYERTTNKTLDADLEDLKKLAANAVDVEKRHRLREQIHTRIDYITLFQIEIPPTEFNSREKAAILEWELAHVERFIVTFSGGAERIVELTPLSPSRYLRRKDGKSRRHQRWGGFHILFERDEEGQITFPQGIAETDGLETDWEEPSEEVERIMFENATDLGLKWDGEKLVKKDEEEDEDSDSHD